MHRSRVSLHDHLDQLDVAAGRHDRGQVPRCRHPAQQTHDQVSAHRAQSAGGGWSDETWIRGTFCTSQCPFCVQTVTA